jgi:hypothetical protein
MHERVPSKPTLLTRKQLDRTDSFGFEPGLVKGLTKYGVEELVACEDL